MENRRGDTVGLRSGWEYDEFGGGDEWSGLVAFGHEWDGLHRSAKWLVSGWSFSPCLESVGGVGVNGFCAGAGQVVGGVAVRVASRVSREARFCRSAAESGWRLGCGSMFLKFLF